MARLKLNAVDLFAGCGGLSVGLNQAGFDTRVAVEVDGLASETYRINHPNTKLIEKDIRLVTGDCIKATLKNAPIHLLAGCPPCQGFSTVRRLNKKRSARDPRNNLLLEYFRLVKELLPLTIMLENVPGLRDYYLFKKVLKDLKRLGYFVHVEVLNVKYFEVPQSRRRLVMVGSRLGQINVAQPDLPMVTVRNAIGHLLPPNVSNDPLHRIVAKHSSSVRERISLTPKDGGSWKDLPKKYTLKCHRRDEIGFADVYGRMRWDSCSNTITGGCLNPSKGRFLHPQQNRVITPREASLLQSFPQDYYFPSMAKKQALALLIGNALPPKFSFYQSENIARHIESHLTL